MDFINYVENEKKKTRIANIKEVRKDIDKSWVKEKIQNHIDAFEGIFSYEEIRQAILDSDIVASKFCKDPGKQNICEKLMLEKLQVEKLPATGKNCIRFDSNGNITAKSMAGNTKSADCIYNGAYATLKYTKESGGSQDNQRDNVIDFLTKGSISHKVCAIVDGDYWNHHREEIKELFKDNPNVISITSVSELVE